MVVETMSLSPWEDYPELTDHIIRAWVRACMQATVSWMMGGSTRMPCFQITTSFASDCCTEAARAACQCEHMGSRREPYNIRIWAQQA